MAGFAVIAARGSSPQELDSDFIRFLRITAEYKQIKIPASIARGKNILAAKLDSDASIHPGVVVDGQTGSWLLVTGTLVASDGTHYPDDFRLRLLRDYIRRGPTVLEDYDSHFALVIYNSIEDRLSIVSDNIGMFGIYYYKGGNKLLVSSSALAVASQAQASPDILAIEHFLRIGRLDGDKTLWQDVKRLEGGSVLTTSQGSIDQSRYWSPSYDPSIARLPFEQALDRGVDLFMHAFSRALSLEKKTWVDLSGGFDSRLSAMFVEKNNVPFCAYCMGPDDHPDVQLSRKIGEEMGWEYVHTHLPEKWSQDQYHWFDDALGSGDGQVSVLRLAYTLRGFIERNTTMKTNVMGVGGENWRGYYWQIEKGNIGRISNVNDEALLDSIFPASFPVQVMRFDRTREVRLQLSGLLRQLWSKYNHYPNTVQLDRLGIYRDAGHGGAYLSGVASIGRSLAPLCFKSLINFAISLNFRWKLPRHHIFVRALLERENKRLAAFPTTTKGPAVPIRITNIHKFWPLWKSLTNRAVEIGSKKVLRKTIQIWPERPHVEYPLPAWQDAFREFAHVEGLFDHEKMYSGGLYKGSELDQYIERALLGKHRGEFLDRVISVEMALRATNTSID